MENRPVQKVDIMSYAGKWYSLYSVPTFLDKNWRETTETYVIHPDGYYAVFTTYKLVGESSRKYVRSKLFVVRGTGNAVMKAQFLWPFKTDYWVIEIADDYSYVVIGHPEQKYLFLMARQQQLEPGLLTDIILRCDQRGYDTSKLVSQEHHNSISPEGAIAASSR